MCTNETYDILLSNAAGETIPAVVYVSITYRDGDGQRDCRLRIAWADGNVEAVEFSVYHAFASAREQLEPLGLMPQCYGACPEVQVSGAAVDLGDGTIAYRMNDPQVRWGPMVNIFDTGPDISPAPVAEQRNFRKRRRNT